MISTIISRIGSFLSGDHDPSGVLVLVIGLGISLTVLMFEAGALHEDLTLERAAHTRTQEALLMAQEAYKISDAANAGLQNLAQACMEREAQSQAALAERAAIMAKARPRPQSVEEQKEVVDDVTRQAAADRLNRPF